MNISNQAKNITASPTLSLNETANALKAEGKPVINLSIGEPKNKTPENAISRSVSRLQTRSIKYTATGGIPELKDAIIDYTQDFYHRQVDRRNILITVGAKQALVNTFYAILDPGDEVILLAPYWVSYPEMVKIAKGVSVPVSPSHDSFGHSMKAIQEKVTNRTRAIVCNSPNNPSGLIYPLDFVRELVQFCEQAGIFLIMDDIYHQLVFSNASWVPGYQLTKKAIDESHIIVINGVSKTYGMTGFRVGWVIAPKDLIAAMQNLQAQTTSGVSVVTQEAALGALTGSQECIAELCASIKANCEVTLAGLRQIENVTVPEPQGAFYCLPDFSAYDSNSMALAHYLLKEAYVAVVPGVVFGMEGHLRISYAGDAAEVAEGINRIRTALENYHPA